MKIDRAVPPALLFVFEWAGFMHVVPHLAFKYVVMYYPAVAYFVWYPFWKRLAGHGGRPPVYKVLACEALHAVCQVIYPVR